MSLAPAGSLSLASARQLPPGGSLYTHNRVGTKQDSTTFYVRRRTVGGSDGSATKWEERLERVAAVSRGRGGLPTKANAGYRNRIAGPYGECETEFSTFKIFVFFQTLLQ